MSQAAMSSPRKMFPMPSTEPADLGSSPPERFVVEVFSELRPETIQKRWEDVNVILRMSMLTGLANATGSHAQPALRYDRRHVSI